MWFGVAIPAINRLRSDLLSDHPFGAQLALFGRRDHGELSFLERFELGGSSRIGEDAPRSSCLPGKIALAVSVFSTKTAKL